MTIQFPIEGEPWMDKKVGKRAPTELSSKGFAPGRLAFQVP